MNDERPAQPRARFTREVREAQAAGRELEAALRWRLRGEVRFSAGDRALYATDASNYRAIPIGVALPRDADDVVEAIAVAREHDAPVLMRGGGTSLAGQCCNVALVLDTSKYLNRVLEIDPAKRTARVEPGCVLDELQKAAAKHDLIYGPDPATHSRCTLGGMIGNNSCGVHSVLAELHGRGAHTLHQVESLSVTTYDGLRLTVGPTPESELREIIAAGGRRGEIYAALASLRDRYADEIRRRFSMKVIRRSSGFPLHELLPENGFNVARALVGTEGTCVSVLEATVALMPKPKERALLVLGYPSVYDAGDHVIELRAFKPIGLEGMDDTLIDHMKRARIHPEDANLMPPGRGFIIAEFAGETAAEALDRAGEAESRIKSLANPPSTKILADKDGQKKVWEVRESGLGATAFVPGEPDAWEGWEDSSVPVEHVGDYLRALRSLFDKYKYNSALYGHFGQGCIHLRINFDLYTVEGIEKYRAFTEEAAHIVCDRFGGSLSGEHGDGQSRGELLPIMFGDEMVRAFQEFKAIWDPRNRMNPARVVNAPSRSENLRLGADYAPAQLVTHFQYPQDDGAFARGPLRCVGVGACRRHEGGTMCPSYMATREEKHSTRGRAHLLFEMLQGETITDGWRSDAVKESLDLCLACKGCKDDCPVHVDLATYKAEFLAHYYRRRPRPRQALAFGMIDRWADVAATMPGLANFFTQTPGFARVAKWAANVSPHRRIPRFARHTFRGWFERRPPGRSGAGADRVILWPDTFNDHFYPGTLVAAVEVLESVGCDVTLPRGKVCCGRPLYDFGLLDRAKAYLRNVLDVLREELAAGTFVVGIEPSCVSVFRDELVNLFPHDEFARRLRAQTVTLSEYLTRHRPGVSFPLLARKALVHSHCHHKSIMKTEAVDDVLEAMKVDYRMLDSGCCGMAGAFGFEHDKYDLSIAIGERVLLPAVRQGNADTIVMADGFSCREQIAQTTRRRALHLAEVLQLALHPESLTGSPSPEAAAQSLVPRELRM